LLKQTSASKLRGLRVLQTQEMHFRNARAAGV